MYNVLFADDEPLILEGLRGIIDWATCSVQPVGAALDGAEALAMMGLSRVDILVTDIRMPVMDGLDLLREIRTRGMDTRVVILSGYDDFEYVREAAVLGIENYLLKPLDPRELEKTVMACVAKLEDPHNRRDLVRQGLDVIRDNLLLSALFGTIQEDLFREKLDVLRMSAIEPGFIVAEILPVPATPQFARKLGALSPRRIAPGEEKDTEHVAVVPQHADRLFVLFHNRRGAADRLRARAALIAIRDRVERETGHRCRACLGMAVDSFAEIASSTRSAEELERLPEADGQGGIVDWEERSLLTRPVRHPLVQSVIRQVHENLDKPMSLKTLSHALGANAAYLGRLFAAETGRSFSAYLREHRIRTAALLIRNTGYKMRDVARLVGFPDPRYFDRIFKDVMGCTPTVYRLDH